MKRLRLLPKTFLFTLSLMLTIVVIAHGLIYLLLPTIYTMQQRQALEERTEQLARSLETASESDLASTLQTFSINNVTGIEAQVFGKRHIINRSSVLGPTTGGEISVTEGQSADAAPLREGQDSAVVSQDVLTVERVIENDPSSFVKVTQSLESVTKASQAALIVLPISGLVCALVAVLFAYLFARSITRPISTISAVAERMEQLDPEVRAPVTSEDEIGALAVNLNRLFETLLSNITDLEDSLADASRAERDKAEFMRAASHELKTPVTAASLMVENMQLGIGPYRDHNVYLPRAKALLEHLSGMISNMLDASKLAVVTEQPTAVSIRALTLEVEKPYEVLARSRGIRIESDFTIDFTVLLPVDTVAKVLSNVLSNAVRYTNVAGKVTIRTERRALIIENTTDPIDANELPRLTEAFYRPDFARGSLTGGTGLGLYIVDTSCRALGLPYSFVPTESNDGMRFKLDFSLQIINDEPTDKN